MLPHQCFFHNNDKSGALLHEVDKRNLLYHAGAGFPIPKCGGIISKLYKTMGFWLCNALSFSEKPEKLLKCGGAWDILRVLKLESFPKCSHRTKGRFFHDH